MAAQKTARASPELRKAPLSPRYRWNYTIPRGTTLADGIDLKKLKSQKYGHNLTALSSEAINRGLVLSNKDENLLSFMPSTEDMIDLRYLKVGVRTAPDFEEIDETCENLYRLVGYEIQKRGVKIGFHASHVGAKCT